MGQDLLRDAAREDGPSPWPAPRGLRPEETAGSTRGAPTSGPRRPALLGFAAAASLLGAALLSGCFIEIARPPQFRYSCDLDDDCPDGESCIGTLCQVPCTTATAAEACPSDAGYVGCFNGGCASLCNVGDDVCPAPQTCIGASGETGGGGDDEGSTVGLCGAACSADDPSSCPDGETCVMGACVLTCVETNAEPCPDGLVCALGACVSDQLPFSGSLPANGASVRATGEVP